MTGVGLGGWVGGLGWVGVGFGMDRVRVGLVNGSMIRVGYGGGWMARVGLGESDKLKGATAGDDP